MDCDRCGEQMTILSIKRKFDEDAWYDLIIWICTNCGKTVEEKVYL